MNAKQDKTIVVKTDFQYGRRVMVVQIDEREYNTEHLTRTSTLRLLNLLDSIPTNCRQVQFESDFTPKVFLDWKRQSEPETLDAEYDTWADSLREQEVDDSVDPEPAAPDFDPDTGNPLCPTCGLVLDEHGACEHCDPDEAEWLREVNAPSDDEPETCDCGRAIASDGSHHPDCQCCEACGEFPCTCKRARKSDEDDTRSYDPERARLYYGWNRK